MTMASSPPTSCEEVLPSSTTRNDSMEHLWDRFDYVKLYDDHKNALLKEVLTKYEYLSQQHHEMKEEFARERMYSMECDVKMRQLGRSVNTLQSLLNCDPFILLLIDGDGMIFRSGLLREGEEGGKRAAALLHAAVSHWSATHIKELPGHFNVVCRIYADVKGLANACAKAKIVDSSAQVESFARGFTKGRALFDFIDVGSRGDCAHEKIAEIFKLHLFDFHCRQILFGCSHDNGYTRLLEEHTSNAEAKGRVTLVGSTPFGKELGALPLEKITLESLFRDTKIDSKCPDRDLATDFHPRVTQLRATSNDFTPAADRTPSPASSLDLDGDAMASRNRPTPHLRTNSIASSGQSSDSGFGVFSYANAASKAAGLPLATTLPSVRNVPPTEPTNSTIRRNKKGQRIDVALPYERETVQLLKKRKLCNAHYLREGGCCHDSKPEKCAHDHDYKPTKAELGVLKVVARESPCRSGTECEDAMCIYGHRCPFPAATQGSMRGKGCLVGEGCRFPEEMHGLDLVTVKASKVIGAA